MRARVRVRVRARVRVAAYPRRAECYRGGGCGAARGARGLRLARSAPSETDGAPRAPSSRPAGGTARPPVLGLGLGSGGWVKVRVRARARARARVRVRPRGRGRASTCVKRSPDGSSSRTRQPHCASST